LGGDDTALAALAPPGVPTFSLAPFWGSTRIGAAFHLAAAVLMRRDGRFFPGGPPLATCGSAPAAATQFGNGPIQLASACGSRCRVTTLHA
jgi:hypothetical protein